MVREKLKYAVQPADREVLRNIKSSVPGLRLVPKTMHCIMLADFVFLLCTVYIAQFTQVITTHVRFIST